MSLQAQTKARHKVMGVLDIYGFEIFEVRQIAAQTSLFLSWQATRTQSDHPNIFITRKKILPSAVCVHVLVPVWSLSAELIKPHWDQISSVFVVAPGVEIIFVEKWFQFSKSAFHSRKIAFASARCSPHSARRIHAVVTQSKVILILSINITYYSET